jgi:glycosyltransferase (activator-dependent family)
VRVLFTTYSDKSLFQYLVPAAWALRTAGHEVRIAVRPGFEDEVTQAGLTALPVGGNRDPWRLAAINKDRLEADRGGLPEPYDILESPEKLSWDYLVRGYAGKVGSWLKMVSVPMIAELVEFARHWQPDLVVWEPNCYAGPIAARAAGAAHARIMYGLDIFGVTRERYLTLRNERPHTGREDPLGDWLASYARKYGFAFDEDMVTGQFTIDQFPTSLQMEADSLHYLRMGYVPYGGPATVPRWLWEPSPRPRVGLTLGLTASYRFGGYPVDVQELLSALSDLDIEVVATIADRHRRAVPRVPDNTRIVPYVPLHALAPTCAVMIHHAGAATLATTSRYGVPQLALPLHFDQPMLGAKLAAQGAGLSIHAGEATGDRVREAVRALLDQPSYRAAAGRLRAEMEALPSPNNLVTQIEEATAKYRPR